MSMRDFRDLMAGIGLRIVKESPIIRGRSVEQLPFANLRADSAFYLLERDPNHQTPAPAESAGGVPRRRKSDIK
jgi:hypothetical protein